MIAMPNRLKLTGTKEIAKKLKQMDETLRKKAVDPALRAGLKIVAEQAKDNAPEVSGKLKNNIVVRKAKKKTQLKGATKYHAGVLTKVFYFRFVEYGVPSRGIAANPFFRRAWESKQNEAIRASLDVLRKKLKLSK